MKIVRTFWGDLHRMGDRYPNQIKNAVNDNLNELVYVWGVDNYKFISELGYECKLISEDNFNRDLASDHIFYDHKSPNHKLYTINQALKDWDEILFLDWDCNVTKNLDENFYKILRSGGSLQAPLYIYPKKSIDWMIEETKKEEINPFFTKLKKLIGKYSYEWKDNYIVPNAGLIYCRDKNIDLLKQEIQEKNSELQNTIEQVNKLKLEIGIKKKEISKTESVLDEINHELSQIKNNILTHYDE